MGVSRVEIAEAVLMEHFHCDRGGANIVANILFDALDKFISRQEGEKPRPKGKTIFCPICGYRRYWVECKECGAIICHECGSRVPESEMTGNR